MQQKSFLVSGHQKQHSQDKHIVGISMSLLTPLGAPMLHQRTSRNSYTFILDKMCKKLTSWKTNNLSFAGRITLAQSSLSCIPGYVMQTANIPASVCDEAEKICRDFIWGSTANQRKCHLYLGRRFVVQRRRVVSDLKTFVCWIKPIYTNLLGKWWQNPTSFGCRLWEPNTNVALSLYSFYCCS
jgi:hypothetical protein